MEEVAAEPAAEELPGSKAVWTFQDEATMITFFQDKKNIVGTVSLFKHSNFVELAGKLNSSRLKGGVKSVSSCQSKWSTVCIPFVYVFLPVF